MSKPDSDHEQLIKRGLRLHEGFRYYEALRFFRKAFRLAPDCPAVIYNLANTLHMLGRDKEAHALLTKLLEMRKTGLLIACPILRQPASFQTDAHYLMSCVAPLEGR